jgi:hypothetical protein
MTSLDIEDSAQLRAYLTDQQHIERGEAVEIRPLAGGVSNRTMWLRRANGDEWVIKQALAKLRVQVDWFSDPQRIHREAVGLKWLPRFIPPEHVPALIFEDIPRYILAMRAVPQPHHNWKSLLLAGELDFEHVRQFASLLAQIHRGSAAHPDELIPLFGDQTFFHTLRIEAYYRFTASRHPSAAPFYDALITESSSCRAALVHGDYSPKNVLVYQYRLILLDHEVMHWGDPAFDIGFSMTHLLSKAHHLAPMRQAFAQAAQHAWHIYNQTLGDVAWRDGYAARAARHILACLLARIDGRSPLEYLTPESRAKQRAVVLELIANPPTTVPDVIAAFTERL